VERQQTQEYGGSGRYFDPGDFQCVLQNRFSSGDVPARCTGDSLVAFASVLFFSKSLIQETPNPRCELIRTFLHEEVTRCWQNVEPLGSGNIVAKSLAPLRPEVRVILRPNE